jgi:branched-subunit amino acid transport protein
MLTILGMLVVTYACRGGGYWVFRQFRPTAFIRSMLEYLPGSLFVAYVVPGLLAGIWWQWIAAGATVATMAATRNFAWAIAAGTATAWLAWWLT